MMRAQVGSAVFGAAIAAVMTAASAFEAVALTTTGVARAEMRVIATRVAVRVMTGSPGRAQRRLHGGDHLRNSTELLCGRTHRGAKLPVETISQSLCRLTCGHAHE